MQIFLGCVVGLLLAAPLQDSQPAQDATSAILSIPPEIAQLPTFAQQQAMTGDWAGATKSARRFQQDLEGRLPKDHWMSRDAREWTEYFARVAEMPEKKRQDVVGAFQSTSSMQWLLSQPDRMAEAIPMQAALVAKLTELLGGSERLPIPEQNLYLGNLRIRCGDPAGAIEAYQAALNGISQSRGAENPVAGNAHAQIAFVHTMTGNQRAAREEYRAAARCFARWPDLRYSLAPQLQQIVATSIYLNDLEAAEEACGEIEQLCRSDPGMAWFALSAANGRADVARARQQFVEAEAISARAAEEAKSKFGISSPVYGAQLRQLALNRGFLHNRENTRATYREAIGVLRAGQPQTSGDLVLALNAVAALDIEDGQAASAEAAATEALAVARASPLVIPADTVLDCIVSIANSLAAQRRFSDAQNRVREAISLADTTKATSAGQACRLRLALFDLQIRAGEAEFAESTLDEAVSCFGPILQSDSLTFSSTILSITGACNQLMDQGKFGEGIRLGERALQLCEHGPTGAQLEMIDQTSTWLALLYAKVGNISAKRQAWIRALDSRERRNAGPEKIAHAQRSIAECDVQLLHYEEAEARATKGLSLLDSPAGAEAIAERGQCLRTLAEILSLRGDVVGAERRANEAVTWYQEKAPRDPGLNLALLTLSTIQFSVGNAAGYKATRALQREFASKVLGEQPDGSDSLADFIGSEETNPDAVIRMLVAESEAQLAEVTPDSPDGGQRYVMAGTSSAMARDWKKAAGYYRQALLFAERFGTPSFYVAATPLGMLLSERLAQPDEAIRLLERAASDFESTRTATGLTGAKSASLFSAFIRNQNPFRELCRAHMRTAVGKPAEAQSEPVRSAFDALERGRGRAMLELLGGTSEKPVSSDEISARLGTDEVLFIYDIGDSDSYLFAINEYRNIVIRPLQWSDGREVTYDTLAPAIARFIADLAGDAPPNFGTAYQQRREMRAKYFHDAGPRDYSVSELFEALVPLEFRERVWPVARRIYIAPDGPLHTLPFTALATSAEGKRWIDDGPPVVYVESGSLFARRRSQRVEPNDSALYRAVLVGGVKFSTNSEIAARYRPLPGSGVEIRGIAPLLAKSAWYSGRAKLLTGEEASIAALAGVVDRPSLLHLATHGFAGPPGEALQGGLVFAAPAAAPATASILTVEKLLADWRPRLGAVDLVVLSACETARGDVESGSGSISLAWSMLAAGSRNVISTFWRVDDRAASLLMIRFYENLLGEHDDRRTIRGRSFGAAEAMPKAEALFEAQRWLRALDESNESVKQIAAQVEQARRSAFGDALEVSRREFGAAQSHLFAHPFFWAAFGLTGDGE